MNAHSLRVLDLPDVLERIASRALSPMGREAILGMRPATEAEAVRGELQRVADTAAFLEQCSEFAPPAIVDARQALRRLAVPGSVLDGSELHSLGVMLESGRLLGEALDRHPFPSLRGLRERLYADRQEEAAIRRSVEPDGSLPDSASRELGRIRNALRRTRSSVVQKLEGFLRTLPERFVVSDASVTLRNGRYAIPIRREGRGEVGGIVHDESASGATLFVEPPLAIEITNRIRELEREEEREILRILREFTDRLRAARELLLGSHEALVEFDTLYARARTAGDWRGEVPEILSEGGREIRIVEGRHPLLATRGESPVVPFDLELSVDERILIVSGPNAGGKTVLLKAVGLISVLAQAGVIPPVGAGTRLPLLREVFADIGDEQSIAESLSTFSAHVSNLKEILEGAAPDTMVLLDELGTGTDPEEGAALARSILEELRSRDALTLATSHLGALKRLAEPGSGVVNASLQFDPDRLEPTFSLRKGRPGRSYGLAIARRMGLSSGVLDRAASYVSSDEARMEVLLEELERREREASRALAALERDRAAASELLACAQEREAGLDERERTAERKARDEARKLLLEARQEVERAIQRVQEAHERDDFRQVAREARRGIEDALRQHRLSPAERLAPAPASGVPRPGDRVRLVGGGATGVLVEVRDERATMEADGLRIQVPFSDLVRVDGGAEPPRRETAAAAAWTGPVVDASPEVDLRGLRVDEAEPLLVRALDEAVLCELHELRVIHGKGTGALRNRVAELLEEDTRVVGFRLGLSGEGGSGVTVVRLR